MSAPREVLDLIDRFQRNADAYRSPGYNETQVRRELIDPFFKYLGWDIDNTRGAAEAYKDVIHEDALKIGGAHKAPDYCFRIGGTRKFFLEAKKPAVDIKNNPEPAFQLRRYAWSAKLPLSILTDFEEFAVYDCRIKPSQADKASAGRIQYFTFTDYPKRWDYIASIFSKDAIDKGSFDKYAEAARLKKGTATVDTAFLEEIESWREMLAKNIALRNDLNQRELNYAVQVTIDRILFLRMCEDRGVEQYPALLGLTNGEGIYGRLKQLFVQADHRYNSGLFHFEREADREPPDDLTLSLKIDDKPLKDIITSLYYPDSPYEFSVLPAEILGQVYEQFLGKVIRLTDSGRAVIADKPEVRKAGGVYYTPTHIVDYIVKNTVGKLLGSPNGSSRGAAKVNSQGREPLDQATGKTASPGGATESSATTSAAPSGLETAAQPQSWGSRPRLLTAAPPGLTPKQASKLRILDPACGSGSFLLGAYQYLLDWHRDWYVADGPDKHTKAIYQGRGGFWRLTAAEKKRILQSNIYGVDIDPQAVEVTKLSLLLKVLEGETKEALQHQLSLYHERALPDLAGNIKCGNSLIAPDFYEGRQGTLFDDEEQYRINAFDWNKEFPAIMKAGGFDAVIGNPPYVRMEEFKELKEYLRRHYSVHDERTDFYAYFIEKEHSLLRKGGIFGMIVSNKFLRANYGRKIREAVRKAATIERILDFAGLPVFRGATVRTIVLITRKGQTGMPARYSPPLKGSDFTHVESGAKQLEDLANKIAFDIPQATLSGEAWALTRAEHAALIERLRKDTVPLTKIVDGKICMGIKSGLTEAFVIHRDARREILRKNPEAKEIIHRFMQGRNIRRYCLEANDEYLIYTHHGVDMDRFPKVIEHLRPFKKQLESRATKQAWYELQQPQFAYKELLENPKIVFPDIATTCRFALDTEGHFGANTVYFLPTDDRFLLAILNSKLAQFYFEQTCAALEGPGQAYLRFFGQYLESFPVAMQHKNKKRHARMVSLVEEMLSLHEKLPGAKTPHAQSVLERQIAATDRQIDNLVYELYGLTEEEIKIVEGATP